MRSEGLNILDYSVVLGYFALVFAVAWFFSRKRKKKQETDSADYFLGGRELGWFAIGASLFASNIGSEHLVGLAGAGASGAFPAAQFELIAAFILLLLGWLFVPFYLKSGVFTMPEFLERRYDSWSRSYLSWVSILSYILTKISVTIAAGGIIFTALLGIDFWTGAIVVVVATGLYTLLGGLKAVVYTDMVQMFIFLAGAFALTFYGLNAVGGWSEVKALAGEDALSLWRPTDHPDFPWTGIIFGAPILGVWYWCTDQFIVQRVLSAKNVVEARKSTIFAGYLKVLPIFLFVIPGVIAYALFQKGILEFPVSGGNAEYDAALPAMTMQLLPAGLRGVVVAGLIAALMSSLSSVFNSSSTLFTMDIYKKYRPESSEKHLVLVGQISTVVLTGLGLLWIPMLRIIEGGLFQKLQSIQAFISPPIAAVFLLGLFIKKINANGARVALISGAVLGVLRLVLELNKPQLSGFALAYAEINFLHFALILFVICSAILIGSSLLMPKQLAPTAEAVMYTSEGVDKGSSRQNTILTVLLILIILTIWYVFS